MTTPSSVAGLSRQALQDKECVFLIDGSGYIFRAFHAVAPLSTSTGFPTNALFGFTRMVLKLLKTVQTSRVVAVFDAGRETFRTKLFPAYKANRGACPEPLIPQLPLFRTITEALGCLTVELPDYEADDVIGTLAGRLSAKGVPVVVVSGDKDLLQLVGGSVIVWDPMKDRWFDEAAVVEHVGVPAAQMVEYLGLVGDTSDNIPGVDGVGPKTAVQLLQKFHSVAGVLANVEVLEGDKSIRGRTKLAEVLRRDPEIVRLSRQLAEVCTTAPVQLVRDGSSVVVQEMSIQDLLAACERKPVDTKKLEALSAQLEFDEIFDPVISSAKKPARAAVCREYQTVWEDQFGAWVDELRRQSVIAIDVESTSLDPREAEIVGVSFCWDDVKAWYVPVGHLEVGEQLQVSWDLFASAVGPMLADPQVGKVGHNLKYDFEVLLSHGIEVQGIVFDTMIASYLLQPDRRSHAMDNIAPDELGITPISYEDVTAGLASFANVDVVAATNYSAEDAHVAWLLRKQFAAKIIESKLEYPFYQIEMPLVPILGKIEQRGVRIDTAWLGHLSKECEIQLSRVREQIVQAAGREFNFNSPKQLAEVLFGELGLSTKGLKKTKTGVSTDASVLEKLRHVHPLPGFILEHRTLVKLKGTYIDVLPTLVSQKTGRLHTKFNQAVTGTGRLSSSDPNLQNIPVQTELGRLIRRAFIPREGTLLLSADYSQIELRLLAHMSEDPVMISAFRSGADIHEQTAREIFHLSAGESVSKEQRRVGKTINFGVVYGMGPYALSEDLGISFDEAQRYISSYFERYSMVKKFFAALEAEASATGAVRTMFGRHRVIAELDSTGRGRGFLSRAAVNAPIQGSAADIIKLAMIRLEDAAAELPYKLEMVLQIHDELLFECAADQVDAGRAVVASAMEGVYPLLVPLKVDIGVGTSWLDLE
jgi:DNA polymerase-1